jgi:ribosomal RNA-processing protein 12
MPISERLFERKVKAETEGRQGEAKVWEVVIGQVWDCLPGFFDLARDLQKVKTFLENFLSGDFGRTDRD